MSKAATAFRTISEVSEELDVPKHVLRFWEMKFPQIKPMKRGGGRRYYRPEDMALLKGICHLLHAEAYTIKGVQKILRERGVDAVKDLGEEETPAPKAARKSTKAVAAKSVVAKGSRATAKSKAKAPAASKTASRRGRGKATANALGEEAAAIDKDVVDALNRAIAELQACRSALLTAPPARKTKARTSRAARN